MSEVVLDQPSDSSEIFHPNASLPVQSLTFQSGEDIVTVSLPLVGVAAGAGSLAAFVSKNLASGFLSAAGGQIFASAMQAIGLGGDSVTEELKGALKDISNRLEVVERTVIEIKELCEEILHRLEALQTSMEQSLLEGNLGTAFSNIRAAYGRAGIARANSNSTAALSTPTMMELLTSLALKPGKKERELYAEAFCEGTQSQWNLTMQIETIHSVLTQPVGHSKSLLNRWAEGLILAMRNKEISLDDAYQTLEGYFLQAVGEQLTAVAMHCFVLGKDANPDLRLKHFLEKDFGGQMKEQTDEFLYAVERLALSGVHLLKVPSVFTMEESGEFPIQMESIFLRADLLCAALNLVSNKRDVPSPKEAIAGIYGRCLARQSSIVDHAGPKLTVPDIGDSRGTVGRPLESLKAVDLRRDGTELILADIQKSAPIVVRYYFPWKAKLPESGKPIDTRLRHGLRPAFYDVFGDKDWPLAAGFVDFSPLFQGAPVDAPPKIIKNTLFRTDNLSTGFEQEVLVPQPVGSPVHPLVRPTTNFIVWRFASTSKANGLWDRTAAFHIFKYQGAEARMRLHLHVCCTVWSISQPKPSISGKHFVNHYAQIEWMYQPAGKPNENTRVYDSLHEQNEVLWLQNRPQGYRASVAGWKTLDFTVKPGDYSLHLNFLIWKGLDGGGGWPKEELSFEFRSIFVEWL